ncbi:MAG: hypothetical protein QNJ68_23825, partial [Microcoleaceae cyanobacterium MO_207.B10]|nr:hypothetical protein [Microcoleaceae cyanobacterium MO_207.B10]
MSRGISLLLLIESESLIHFLKRLRDGGESWNFSSITDRVRIINSFPEAHTRWRWLVEFSLLLLIE